MTNNWIKLSELPDSYELSRGDLLLMPYLDNSGISYMITYDHVRFGFVCISGYKSGWVLGFVPLKFTINGLNAGILKNNWREIFNVWKPEEIYVKREPFPELLYPPS